MTEIPLLLASTAAALVAGLLAGLAIGRRDLRRARSRLESAVADLERLQLEFSRFAPPAVVERIIESGIPASGEKKEVTVLFADLAGFTALSETVDPAVLVRIVNGYFERMARAITEHQGHISTLIGDGILALFGALEPNPWHSDDAARAALAMRSELAAYNAELESEALPRLSFGVGLHRGVGVSGLVGSSHLMQLTVVGTVVNVAARVQDLTREHGVDVLLTADVQRALDPRFALRPLPARSVRGVSGPVTTFALLGPEG